MLFSVSCCLLCFRAYNTMLYTIVMYERLGGWYRFKVSRIIGSGRVASGLIWCTSQLCVSSLRRAMLSFSVSFITLQAASITTKSVICEHHPANITMHHHASITMQASPQGTSPTSITLQTSPWKHHHKERHHPPPTSPSTPLACKLACK